MRAIARELLVGCARILTAWRGLAQVVSVRSFERRTVLSTDDVSVGASCVDWKGVAIPAEGAARPTFVSGVDAAEACAARTRPCATASVLAATARSRLLAVMSSPQPRAVLA